MPPVEIVQLAIIGGGIVAACFVTAVAFKAWRGDKYLCQTCKYNNPQSCHKTERPHAVDCAAYLPKPE